MTEPRGLALIRAHRALGLTDGERRVLTRMRDHPHDELTWAEGGGWWVGTVRVPASVVKRLLLKVYISESYRSAREDYLLYTLNEDGLAALRRR